MRMWVLLGMLLGILLSVSPGSLLMFVVIAGCAAVIWRNAECGDRRFLLKTFLISAGVRIIAAFITHSLALALGYAAGNSTYLPGIGDDVGYSGMGWALVKYWHGGREDFVDDASVLLGTYFLGFHTYLHALLYELFGWVPLILKYLNAAIGSLVPVFMFWLTKDLYGRTVARWVCLMVALIPSLFYWSISNLKDPTIVFAVVFLGWALIRWRATTRYRYLLYALLGLGLIEAYRDALFRPIVGAVLLTVPWLVPWPRLRRIAVGALVAIGVVAVLHPAARARVEQFTQHQVWTAMSYQVSSYYYRGETYQIYPPWVYERYRAYDGRPPEATLNGKELASAVVKGWAYFFLTPFPWQIDSLLHLMAFPQVALCYLLIPAVALGGVVLWRTRTGEMVILTSLVVLIATAMALAEANIGAALRHRDILLPFYLLFGVIGVTQWIRPTELRCHA